MTQILERERGTSFSELEREVFQRIETGHFHSETDRSIAITFFRRLVGRVNNGTLDTTIGQGVLESLFNLVPYTSPDTNMREIHDTRITPPMEKTIQSRLSSEEVDIFNPQESWGKLPQQVRQQLVAVSESLLLEMTTNCTVKCSFCALANKGPIARKIAFESIGRLAEEFVNYNTTPSGIIKSDGLYWGTDPFDAKWSRAAGELDYLDAARLYWDIVNGRRSLYTSTAVPLGEEWRVLRFADYFIREKRTGSLRFDHFRISRTSINSDRVSDIEAILTALHGDEIDQLIEISNPREGMAVAKRGAMWRRWEKHGGPLNDWDILGPNCRDGIIIGIDEVKGVAMVGASPDVAKGELYFPITQPDPPNTTYTIPYYEEKPTIDRHRSWDDLYPPIRVLQLTVRDSDGHIIDQQTRQIPNPHRTFARFVAKLSLAYTKWGSLRGLQSSQRAELRRRLQPDADVLQDFLNQGHENQAIEGFLNYAQDLGLID